MLEADDGDIDNELDTYGFSYSGKYKLVPYRIEYAQQDADDLFKTYYIAAEAGLLLVQLHPKLVMSYSAQIMAKRDLTRRLQHCTNSMAGRICF